MSNRRRRHPQVIRAQELARAAGLNPYATFEVKNSWGSTSRKPTYSRFMDAAFEEHFAREAVDNIYWDHGGSFYTERWDIRATTTTAVFGMAAADQDAAGSGKSGVMARFAVNVKRMDGPTLRHKRSLTGLP